MGSQTTVAGMEVPFVATDSVKWIELSVPPGEDDVAVTATITSATGSNEDGCSSSCSVIGVDPPHYFIWRIHKKQPRTLELLQLSASDGIGIGLRITFPHPLFPFAYICLSLNHDQISGSSPANPYLLYALSSSGVAYLFPLMNFSAYSSFSAFSPGDFISLDLQNCYSSNNSAPAPPITSLAATSGCLIVGRNDGSVASFQLGSLHPSAPGFANELRDDFGMGRLWSLVSRGRMVGLVQDLVISEAHGQKFLFVLHSDGVLRVWDLSSRNRILSHTMTIPNSEGATFSRLWVGEFDEGSSRIPLAILLSHTLVSLCKLM